MNNLPEHEVELCKWVVSEYLRYGSVDELLRANQYDIPLSYPTIHRILDKWEVIKAVGPNGPLSETIGFFVKLAEEKVNLESLYRKMPISFTPALSSMHRVYRDLKVNFKKSLEERDLRRAGTALLIYPEDNPGKVLIGYDRSPRVDLGKPYGAVSVPMGFSKKGEDPKDSLKRVLQQEVFMQKTVDLTFPKDLIPKVPRPFMYVDVVDVRVGVYAVALPKSLTDIANFSSHKLKKQNFLPLLKIESYEEKHKFRAGLSEILDGYKTLLEAEKYKKAYVVPLKKSWINAELDVHIELEAKKKEEKEKLRKRFPAPEPVV